MTLRHNGRLHHIGIGRTYAGTYVTPGLAVAGGVQGQFAEDLAGGGVGDRDVEVLDHPATTTPNTQQRTYKNVGPLSPMS